MKFALGIVSVLLFPTLCLAAQPDRITATIDNSQTVLLRGNVHGNVQREYDQGPVDPSMRLEYITMQMKPSAAQQADLKQLLAEQQNPASPNYHKWLTPEQYAGRFGLSTGDIEKIEIWLRSQGFSVVQVARGRDWIAFSGTAELVESTFRTEMHRYYVEDEWHFSNATPLSIPAALNGIVIGFRGLNDFRLKPMGIRNVVPEIFPDILRPFYTNGGGNFLAPDDVATIYDISPLYSAGIDGTGMQLVVVGQTDIKLTDIENFRSGFNLSKNDPTVLLVPGSPDPGVTGDEGEADLDLEWSGAVARNAKITYVNSAPGTGGVFNSASYAIDQDLAPVISMSYGGCESTNAGFIPGNEPTMQKASAEGITFLASSGDTGAAACDANGAKLATKGLAVNYPASSPEVTGVGGTEFSGDTGNPSQYWNTSNGTNGGSAIQYIPETAWNDTAQNSTLTASGGGKSSCDSTGCANGFPKPAWQAGPGVPSDGVRDVPDVAMTASANHDGYLLCSAGSCANGINTSTVVGGTSASTPVFAGIVTLLNQQMGNKPPSGLGNINSTLYTLAATTGNNIFHDITTGSNVVPCQSSPPSPNCPTKAPFQFGYSAGTGYDLVTGLGSVDVNQMILQWTGTAVANFEIAANPTTINITSPGQSGTATITVTPLGGFNQAVSFTCGTLPSEATCSFSPTSVTPSGAAVTTTLTIQTTAASGMLQHPFSRGGKMIYALLLPGLLGMFVIPVRRGRRFGSVRVLSLALFLSCSVLWMAGCGGGSSGSSTPPNPGTPTGTSTVTVTASAGSITHNFQITLNIQ